MDDRRENESDSEVVVIEIDSVANQNDTHLQENDDPPEYATVLNGVEETPQQNHHNSQDPPLSYDAAMATSLPPTVLTVEPPPSYVQLFTKGEGGEEEGDGTVYHRRQHTVSQQEEREMREWQGWRAIIDRLPKIQSSTKCVCIIAVMVFALAIIMVSVGVTYHDSCSIEEVPIYLIVTGCGLLAEMLLHSLLTIFQRSSNYDPVYRLMRRFDPIAWFLVIWLMVGTCWVIKTRKDSYQNDVLDYVLPGNQTDDVMLVDFGIGEQESDCGWCDDCPRGVYGFAMFIILIQYMVVLVMGLCCCTTTIYCIYTQPIATRRRH